MFDSHTTSPSKTEPFFLIIYYIRNGIYLECPLILF